MGTRYPRWLLLGLFSVGLPAQEPDLTSMSLEDFLNVEVVSVSKGSNKWSRTPAAAFVITQEDIRRSGAVSLPEVLRMAPGVYVARVSGSTWAISIRGFSSINSNKLLVLIDGRAIYSPLLSGVLWNENLLMLEDIERVEVIRGPGGALWGANAVTGVINIITKSSLATQGTLVGASAGIYDKARLRARHGGRIGKNAAYRTWAQYSLQGQLRIPEVALDYRPWPSYRGGTRVDWELGRRDSLLIEGEFQNSSNHQVSAATSPAAPSLRWSLLESGNTQGYLLARWNHVNRRGDQAAVQTSFTEDRLNSGTFEARIRTLDLDLQQSFALPRSHTLMVGGGVRGNSITTAGTPAFRFEPTDRTYHILNAFVQDEWQLKPDRWTFTAGAKVEHYTLAGTTFQPTLRLLFTPTAKQSYWVSGSQAVRSPAHTDFAVRLPLIALPLPFQPVLTGSDQFRPEVLKAIEGGGRWQILRHVALDVAAFRHWYKGLATYRLAFDQAAPSPGSGMLEVPAVSSNGMNAITQGAEIAVQYDIHPKLNLGGSYSHLSVDTSFRSGYNPANAFVFPTYTPNHQWQVRAGWNPARNWTADSAFYWVGALPGGALPAYQRLDLRIARRLGESAELSISGQNLLRPETREFVHSILFPSGVNRRNIEIGIRWGF